MLNTVKKLFGKLKIKKVTQIVQEETLIDYETKRKIIDDYRQQYNLNVLVETGTFLGDTIEYFKNKFDELYSIELSKELAIRAMKRFETDKNISIIQGDSGIIFETLIPSLNSPALFWIDGHYSSEFFHNGEFIITAKSDKHTPVEKELDVLLNSVHRNIILIDDARLFTGTSDYPTLEEVKQKILPYSYSMKVENDIIHITPKNIK